jgi:hypothetical protein
MAQEIKKTMEKPLAFLVGLEGKKVTAEMIEQFTTQFCYKADGTSNGPREVTILRVDMNDANSEVLGRKCTVVGRFFPINRFAKNTSCIKEADGAKGKLYNESKAMEKDAQVLLDEARECVEAVDKIAKFEAYDAQLQLAADHRKQPIEVQPEWLEGSFETIEELAASLGL